MPRADKISIVFERDEGELIRLVSDQYRRQHPDLDGRAGVSTVCRKLVLEGIRDLLDENGWQVPEHLEEVLPPA